MINIVNTVVAQAPPLPQTENDDLPDSQLATFRGAGSVGATMSRTLLPFTLSARRGLTLNLLGLFILLVGFSSAGFIWRAQDRIDRQAGNGDAMDLAAAPLAPEDSRRYTHDMEQYYGKTGLLADEWMRWFEGLAHGKPLAKTIAALSLVAACGCFLTGRVSKAGP